ncbi:FecCD family ABC transporter permease [Shewanella salipaludis]|uniref:Iron ABC transporter permease n=1 Tax=Shewanella salipaludis TaxID=2723052 RepID=A0A972JJB3_9GAMM|nr:iron ABC transporter permease [Shewanella salipaludis]NMH64925.1 iron ABC transporter permease [Shewanella salipaludis]
MQSTEKFEDRALKGGLKASLGLLLTPLSLQGWLLLALALLALLTPLLATSFGAANISMLDVVRVLGHKLFDIGQPSAITERIVLELRLPRTVLAFVAGAGLSIAGAVLQLVTRNPLADPYLFGISSGASFGAVVMLTLFTGTGLLAGSGLAVDSGLAASGSGLSAGSGLSLLMWLLLPLGAFCGASLSVLLVLLLSGLGISSQVERMLLSGVATSFMFGALTSLLLYFASPQATASVLFWSLGSFAKASWALLSLPLLVVSLSLLVILALKRQILALQAGDETAHTLGVNVPKLRLGILLLCSLITAILVASCGGIGFVGLMIPHIVRLLFPGRQPILLTALVGGLFMVWIDVLARCLLGNQELPVGIITAAIGSVFFLFVLRRRGRYG